MPGLRECMRCAFMSTCSLYNPPHKVAEHSAVTATTVCRDGNIEVDGETTRESEPANGRDGWVGGERGRRSVCVCVCVCVCIQVCTCV